ncbi:hypothetical protein OG338_18515 [Streptomyces sp. NBC_00726]|uniref:hypothetical protein n=1 Tax=Streptomyces sp. NBC_00726 TaxID=2903674 RepID=UPI003869EE8A
MPTSERTPDPRPAVSMTALLAAGAAATAVSTPPVKPARTKPARRLRTSVTGASTARADKPSPSGD